MANVNFEPIIGQSLSDIGQQRFQWAGFNNRVDEANMARAAQAQEQQNRWLATLAQMQRSDQDHQDDLAMKSDAIARQISANAAASAEDKRRFGIDTEIKRADIAEREKHWDYNKQQADKQEKDLIGQIGRYAESMAPQVTELGGKLEKARQNYNTAVKEFDTSRSQIEREEIPVGQPVTYDGRVRAFRYAGIGPPKDEKVIEMIRKANERLAEAKAASDEATSLRNEYETQWKQLHSDSLKYDVVPQKRGDIWGLFSARHGKFYSGDGEPATVSPPLPSGFNPVWRPSDGAGYESGSAPPTWAGFQSAAPTATATAPNQSPGAVIVNAPNRFAGWMFKRGVVDPGLQMVKEGASGLGDLYNDYTDAVAGPMATAMNWFQSRVLPPAIGNSRVRMRAPDGTTGSIPAWKVEDAKKKRYKVIGPE